ncbi:tape measure protein [Microbacterium phage OscarSo]|uniref:Tape measure protein n=1 Tax=Microbacterium phage OscarSo TaxID=2985324 RepID=A0A9X9P6D5_9CAUD|nr:tape measure protein [Microbacterium phage OscarSo]UYL87147.1 tape measure protein [Microbacterium phage OscarSo]
MAGITLAEGVVEVTADAKGVPREIAKDIEDGEVVTRQAGENIGKKVFGGIIGAWAAIGAAEKIGNFFTGSITGASDLNETLSKSSAIFGSSASAIESWGDTAARTVGLSKEAAIGSAAAFGDMFLQLGFAQDAATGMSTAVVQAAADLGSFSNLETADVAERIAAAFRGEYDSLQAVIPNINAARVESEALAASGKTVASELTAQEKAAAVLAIVQKDGARAMGDFARTSDGAANQQKILTAQMEDQQAKLGGLLLPAWTGFLGVLNDQVVPAIGDVIEWMGENGDTMLILGGIVAGAAASYWAITSAMAIYKAYQIAATAATGGLTFAQWALNAAMSANPIGLIVTAIAALVAGIVWVATQTTFFQDAWAVMTDVIGAAWEWLWTTVLEPVFNAIGTAVGWLVTNVFEPVGGFIAGVVEGIGAVFSWLYNNIIYPVVVGIMLYIGLWAAVITWLWENVASPVFNAIGALFTWLGVNVFGPIGAFIGGVFSAIGTAFSWLYNNIIAPVAGFIGAAIQGAGIVFSWLYNNAIRPAFDGVASAFNWVWGSIISPVIGWISGAIRNVGNTVRDVFGGIGSFIGSAFQAALNVVRGPINGIIGLVNSAIRGLNGLRVTIPDWVPIVGGQTWGLSIPTIPMLARGTNNAPDAFIAGENGPELITGARGSTVRPYDDTLDMLRGDGNGKTEINIEVNEAEDPLGSAGRVAAELRRWRKK